MIYDIKTNQRIEPQSWYGPMVVDALTDHGDISYVVISAVGYAEDEHSVAEANRLFALYKAAPDMLEALLMILDDPNALDGRPRTAKIVYAAIAKAQGQTS